MSVFRSRAVAAALIGCAGLALSGCGRLGAMSRVDPLSVAVYPGGGSSRDPATDDPDCPLVEGVGSYSRGAVNLDCFVFPEDRRRDGVTDTATAGQLAYRRAAAGPTERNRLTALLLKHSDDVCVEEMGRLTGNEALANASLNILGTSATTAANIVTGELAQSILTGVGTFSTGTRSHIRADVYRNTFSYAVSRAITLERQRLRERLEARYGQNLQNFTVDDAIRAANEYHGVCSFYKGLELVLASVEGDQRSRERQLRNDQIDELENQIASYRAMIRQQNLTGDAAKPIEERIDELLDRIQALRLAGTPAAAAASGAQSTQQQQGQQQQDQQQQGQQQQGQPQGR